MLILNARRRSGYAELLIEADSAILTTGLLDDAEAVDMARALVSAAEDLLPGGEDYEHMSRPLTRARLMLEND